MTTDQADAAPRDLTNKALDTVAAGGAGASGRYALSEPDGAAVVAFAHGDTRQPVVLGSLWNRSKPPPA